MWQARYPGRVPSDAHTRLSPIPGRVLRFVSPQTSPPTVVACSRCVVRSVHAGSRVEVAKPRRGAVHYGTESVGPNRNKVRNKSAPLALLLYAFRLGALGRQPYVD